MIFHQYFHLNGTYEVEYEKVDSGDAKIFNVHPFNEVAKEHLGDPFSFTFGKAPDFAVSGLYEHLAAFPHRAIAISTLCEKYGFERGCVDCKKAF